MIIFIFHHHHPPVLRIARIPWTLSRYPSLLAIYSFTYNSYNTMIASKTILYKKDLQIQGIKSLKTNNVYFNYICSPKCYDHSRSE